MPNINRIIVIVMDSVGIGALPDAADFYSTGSNTLGHIEEYVNVLDIPCLQRLGMGNIVHLKSVPPATNPIAMHGSMMELSKGYDSLIGHQEMMGLITENPPPLFPEGLPREIVKHFCRATGITQMLCNKALSGIDVISKFGEEHIRTGFPIIFTSLASSVCHVATHREVIPMDFHYQICQQIRGVCDHYKIGRVLSYPFSGTNGNFILPTYKKHYSMPPEGQTVLDVLSSNNFPVVAIGKISEIFAGQGITRNIPTKSNQHGMKCLLGEISTQSSGLIFVNLIDFDVSGHRNDVVGYSNLLVDFDNTLGKLLPLLHDSDLLIITADHGCDPTLPGDDHTREYVPLLVYSKNLEPRNLGIRETFADVGATILDLFGISHSLPGKSFFKD